MLDPSGWSFERLLWLVPVLFAIHNAEEAPQMERWTHRLPPGLHPRVTTRQFTLAVCLLTLLVAALTVIAANAPSSGVATHAVLGAQAAIGPDEQAVLLESYRALWRVIDPHYHVGTLLQGAGFLLAAWGVFSMRGFSRWLALWLAVPGLLATVQFGLVATGGPFSLLLNSLGVIVGNVALNLAMAVALWHSPAPLVSAVAGDSA